ncbi:protein NDNF-like [Hyperolius riggenbachi]|uniref:protein NDNF-like n=1 Tax=Hyperolius riggenbachi TaxID=752182 RepID=UPI0035A2E8C9
MEKLVVLLLLIYLSSQGIDGLYVAPQLDSNHMADVRRLLPVGHRVDGFLSVDRPMRYYFTTSRDQNTATIKVTPCESPILWTLSFLPTYDSLHPRGSHKKHRHRGPQILHSFKGNEEEAFTSAVSSDAFYFLDIISLESDTSFQVFIWNNQDEGAPWPQLPADSRVDVLSVHEDKVKLSWKPSSADNELEYCVYVNKKHNFKTLCATQIGRKQDSEGHQDMEDDKSLNIIKEKSKHKVNTYPKTHKGLNIPGVVEHDANELWPPKNMVGSQSVCIGPWTNATIHGLRPRNLYYFDVFAVNLKDSTSVAYTGTFAETKPKLKSQLVKLPDHEMVDIFLKSKGIKIISVEPPMYGFKWLFVHSCLHKVHIQIMLNGQVQVSQSLQGAKNFKLTGNSRDKFVISLKSSKGGLGLVKFFTTALNSNLPFPNLSSDIGLSVSKKSCTSAVVSWIGSGYENKYCIYARPLEQNLDLRLIHKHQNSCLSTSYRSRAEKVVCRQEGSQILVEENITDLKPGKAYLIDLYFISLHNNTIKFPSHVLKTQEWCT